MKTYLFILQKIKESILLNDFKYIDSNLTLCKLYIAITRAKHKVGNVMENKDLNKLNNPYVLMWNPK